MHAKAHSDYDLFICAEGQDPRSRYVADNAGISYGAGLSIVGLGNDFPGNSRSQADFRQNGQQTSVRLVDMDRALLLALQGREDLRPCRVAIDYSCMDRDVIGGVIQSIHKHGSNFDIEIDFFYSHAVFENRPSKAPPIAINRPAYGLEGWPAQPDNPLVCVVGLGYETEFALAALESLEPVDSYLFEPRGLDSGFDVEMWRANEALFLANLENVVTYKLDEPVALYRSLYAFVAARRDRNRIALVPLGPKVFAMVSALVAVQFEDVASMWQVGSSASQLRLPTGQLTRFRAEVREGQFRVGDQ